ncbi:carbohydrate ABC transporter permease, partial [Bifidobacterium animalis subsp. lactis]
MQEKPKHGALCTIFFSMISIAWVIPIVLVLLNSCAGKAY